MHREVRKEGKEGGSLLKLLPRWPVLFVTSFCSSTATLKKSLDRIERRLNTIIMLRSPPHLQQDGSEGPAIIELPTDMRVRQA